MQTREALADCIAEPERVLSLLNTLLDVMKADAGILRLHSVPADLCKLLREVAEAHKFVADDKKF